MPVLMAEFGLPESPVLKPRYNIAPTQAVAALRLASPDDVLISDEVGLAWLRWGLIPGWADDPRIGSRMINARGETVHEKPAFRKAFRERRCLVLADGYYEWRNDPGREDSVLDHASRWSADVICRDLGALEEGPDSDRVVRDHHNRCKRTDGGGP